MTARADTAPADVTGLAGGRNPAVASRSSGARPGLLLDRKCSIIVDHGDVGSIDRVEFIEGVLSSITSFNSAGVPVAVAANQPGVAKGYSGGGHALNLRLASCRVVGDRLEDVGLAQAVGASAVYLGGDGWARPSVAAVPSLAHAVPYIMERIAA